jgi:hypothetical protein
LRFSDFRKRPCWCTTPDTTPPRANRGGLGWQIYWLERSRRGYRYTNDNWDYAAIDEEIDKKADEAKKKYNDHLDVMRDDYKASIRGLPQEKRKPAAGYFAECIDILNGFQKTVTDYISSFLKKAWSVLKDFTMRIKGVVEQIIEAIRSIFSRGGPDPPMHLKKYCENARVTALLN